MGRYYPDVRWDVQMPAAREWWFWIWVLVVLIGMALGGTLALWSRRSRSRLPYEPAEFNRREPSLDGSTSLAPTSEGGNMDNNAHS
jgi:hypothetical protein